MLDFKNSVAHLDVDVSVAVSVSAVVGDNFYKFLYISNEDVEGLRPEKGPILITADTYVDIIDDLVGDDGISAAKAKLMKANIGAFFAYGSSRQGYLISYRDYTKYKYYGYIGYVESEYSYTPADPDDDDSEASLAPDTKTLASLSYLNDNLDTAFTQLFIDVPVDASTASANAVPATVVSNLLADINALNVDFGVFARGANTDYTWDDDDAVSVGYSPAMYQLGRTMSVLNNSGTPIGNSMDTVSCSFQDVLPTRDTSTDVLVNASAMWINWAQTNNVQYFKSIGNGTASIANYGGWTLKHNAEAASWIVAYVNFITKVDVAQIITGMNVYKSPQTYNKCLSAMNDNIAPFIDMGRVVGYQVTAPAFAELPETDGHTITIPNAWTGTYVDNVRKVNIQGAITVNA